ncbi:hypothetical protein LCC91_11260 [Tepidimonas taiwanensis]|uniref:Uncharacterized protein n=1 Tax=Tepidimonas taiwanensis TaxID=307486 RepID=A0A554X4S0_9BURK|nr:hypothetical protein [Tepidimonas taiwanensis]TSE30844.1 hypothetical protein Ttaiw_01776 [Tepidimonas taiwanensis]UBQ05115.1 hypothetical protein LCC91_11260 [Tepidimonas taiwanensis]
MWNGMVVVWRERLEALLVIGVMWSWTTARHDQRRLRAGLGLGGACLVVVASGMRRVPLVALFRLSEWLLLVTATSLLVAGLDRLVAMAWWPTWVDPLWDVSGGIDDSLG